MLKRTVIVTGIIGLLVLLGSVSSSSIDLSSANAYLKGGYAQWQTWRNGSTGKGKAYEVARVIDGDTIIVRRNGEKRKVRLLGVDTPELAHHGNERECFARAATVFMREQLRDQRVILQRDQTQKNTDRYDRLLRYVTKEGDKHALNYILIQEGYGFEYTFNIPYRRQKNFRYAERSAKEHNRGLWSSRTCAGNP